MRISALIASLLACTVAVANSQEKPNILIIWG